MQKDDQINAIHEIVAGVRPLSDLHLLGLDLCVRECKTAAYLRREWTFGSCNEIQVAVTRRTAARGLLQLTEFGWDVEAWAAFILAAPFISVVDAKEEDELIQILWNASAGEPLTEDDFALVTQVVTQEPSESNRDSFGSSNHTEPYVGPPRTNDQEPP